MDRFYRYESEADFHILGMSQSHAPAHQTGNDQFLTLRGQKTLHISAVRRLILQIANLPSGRTHFLFRVH